LIAKLSTIDSMLSCLEDVQFRQEFVRIDFANAVSIGCSFLIGDQRINLTDIQSYMLVKFSW